MDFTIYDFDDLNGSSELMVEACMCSSAFRFIWTKLRVIGSVPRRPRGARGVVYGVLTGKDRYRKRPVREEAQKVPTRR